MKDYKVPVQSLIDHIKTAVDVDPWAKEMAEELLKKQEPSEPMRVRVEQAGPLFYRCYCKKCERYIGNMIGRRPTGGNENFCSSCGQAVAWNENL